MTSLSDTEDEASAFERAADEGPAFERAFQQAQIDRAEALLVNHGDYRILRRFKPVGAYEAAPPGTVVHHGVYVDCETTGLDPDECAMLEIGIVGFTFSSEGRIFSIGPIYNQLHDPGIPIPEEVTRVTGISAETVKGQQIYSGHIEQVITLGTHPELVIAHSADFDRKVLERCFPKSFTPELPWACSYVQVPWREYGVVGGKLVHVIQEATGCFYDAHRADQDCLAGLHVLAIPRRSVDDGTGQMTWRSPFQDLLESTRSGIWRVRAIDAPYELKEVLKQRNYRWTGVKPWFIDCTTKQKAEEELAWLRSKRIINAQMVKISAKDRYSNRALR